MSSVEWVEYHRLTARISGILVFADFGISPGRFSYWSPPFGAECVACSP